MTNEEYRAHVGVSSSEIKAMAKSMAYYKWYKENQDDKDSKALLFGRAYHKYCLEPDTFFEEFIIVPNIDRRTKAGKEEYAKFLEKSYGKDIISQDDFDTISNMRDALYATPYARKLMYGQHEASFFWKDKELNLLCKCRPDSYGKIGNQHICVDLKTCQNAETEAFMRDAIKLGYDIQASHYCDGLKAVTDEDFIFIFIAQEKTAPYCVNILQADEYFMQSGRETRKYLLETYKECMKRDEWPGYMGFSDDAEINTLGVPNWIKNTLDIEENCEE